MLDYGGKRIEQGYMNNTCDQLKRIGCWCYPESEGVGFGNFAFHICFAILLKPLSIESKSVLLAPLDVQSASGLHCIHTTGNQVTR